MLGKKSTAYGKYTAKMVLDTSGQSPTRKELSTRPASHPIGTPLNEGESIDIVRGNRRFGAVFGRRRSAKAHNSHARENTRLPEGLAPATYPSRWQALRSSEHASKASVSKTAP